MALAEVLRIMSHLKASWVWKLVTVAIFLSVIAQHCLDNLCLIMSSYSIYLSKNLCLWSHYNQFVEANNLKNTFFKLLDDIRCVKYYLNIKWNLFVFNSKENDGSWERCPPEK